MHAQMQFLRLLTAASILALLTAPALLHVAASSQPALRMQHAAQLQRSATADDVAIGAPTHSWLLALRLLDKDGLPLVNTSALVLARIQSCRPTLPASPLLLPPSLRSCSSPASSFKLPYAQLECIHVWAENWVERSSIVGLVSIPLTAPAARFASRRMEHRSQMDASTKRMQLRLLKQCPSWTGTDLIWMGMMDFEPSGKLTAAARARGELEWDAQGLAAVLINGPGLPGFKPELETRQLLWPFNPADPVHELDLVIWPRLRSELELKLHPFLSPFGVSEAVSLLERLQSHVRGMQQWWHVLWMLPLCVGLALGLLRLVPVIRRSSAMQTAARRCIEFGELVAEAKQQLMEWAQDRLGERGQWTDNAMVIARHCCEITSIVKERARELGAAFLDSLRSRWNRSREAMVTQLFSASDFIRSKASQLVLPTFPPHLHPGALLDRLFQASKAADAAAYSALLPVVEAASDRWQLWAHSAREAAATAQIWLSSEWIQLMDAPVFSFLDSLSRTVATAIVGALSPSPPAPFVWEGDVAAEDRSHAAEQIAQAEAEVAAERELFGRPEFELWRGQPVAASQEDDGREHFQDLLSDRERMQQQQELEHKAVKQEESEHKQPKSTAAEEQPAAFGWQPLEMDVWSRAEQRYAAARPVVHIVEQAHAQEEEKMETEDELNREQAHAEQQQS